MDRTTGNLAQTEGRHRAYVLARMRKEPQAARDVLEDLMLALLRKPEPQLNRVQLLTNGRRTA